MSRVRNCGRGVLPVFTLLGAMHARAAAPVFNIMDYGARNDGSALATGAFRSAIQAAKAAGGGTVYVPAGRYTTGPIELVSNVTLYFDAGATVEFPAMRLPFTAGREQGIECLTPVPLIGGRGLERLGSSCATAFRMGPIRPAAFPAARTETHAEPVAGVTYASPTSGSCCFCLAKRTSPTTPITW